MIGPIIPGSVGSGLGLRVIGPIITGSVGSGLRLGHGQSDWSHRDGLGVERLFVCGAEEHAVSDHR